MIKLKKKIDSLENVIYKIEQKIDAIDDRIAQIEDSDDDLTEKQWKTIEKLELKKHDLNYEIEQIEAALHFIYEFYK